MKIRGFWYDTALIAFAALLAAGFTVYVSAAVDMGLGLAMAAAIVAVLIFAVVRIILSQRSYRRMLKAASKKMDYSDTKVLSNLPYPAAVCDEDGCVTWCNDKFLYELAGGDISQNFNIEKLVPNEEAYADTFAECGGKYYAVFTEDFHKDSRNFRVFNFIDNTELKKTERAYRDTRPYIMLIETDNIDDSRSDYRDSEKAEIKSRMETMVEDWCDRYNSISKRISDDRLMIVTEKTNADRMKEDKFTILTEVRNFEYKSKNAGVTLSVGMAAGKDIKSAEKSARKALDMALGRGGDQVAIRREDKTYEFVGGVSRSAEKYSKTRARMRANRLAAAISESSNVIVCGHRSSDYDAIGAAVGVAFMAKCLNIPACVAVDRSTTLASPLVEKLEKEGYSSLFVGGADADRLVSKRTLFILVDTHMPSFCEFPSVFEKCERYAIIDHHRLNAASGEEDDSRLYLNPVASSACEMVTEYLTYTVDDNAVPAEIAEALLSGIMLDSKNFVVRTGARTFQAASYLKERGAEPSEVKKLFSNSVETTRIKGEVIMSAEGYGNCFISKVPDGTASPRLIAAQAADDLLSTNGVEAAFVIYEDGGRTCISARSLGEVNVQLVMEALGGGGHQTMAACQLKDVNTEEAKALLMKEIDKLPEKEIR